MTPWPMSTSCRRGRKTRRGWQHGLLLLLLLLASCPAGETSERIGAALASVSSVCSVAAALPPPQGHIIQIVESFALDEDHRVWRSVPRDRWAPSPSDYVPSSWPAKPRHVLGWHGIVLEDGTVQCAAHFDPGMNPTARGGWVGAEWDPDGSPLAFRVGHDLRGWGGGEYVEARGADQVFWGCFRRGTRVYRSGRDFGCPRPNPRVVRTRVEPDLPAEIPGVPAVIGTCWDPVEQPIEAARIFPGCLALDTRGVLHQLHVLRPPVELDRGVRFATRLEDHRIVIVRDDGFATIQVGHHDGSSTLSSDPIAPGPPTPIDLPPLRALFPEGVILEDGTAAMFWSEDQLLRPITGFTAPVELAGGFGNLCVRTEARTVHCRHDLGAVEKRKPDSSPLVLEPAVFDPTRDDD